MLGKRLVVGMSDAEEFSVWNLGGFGLEMSLILSFGVLDFVLASYSILSSGGLGYEIPISSFVEILGLILEGFGF